MTDDLVARLINPAGAGEAVALCREARKEIERLRAERDVLRQDAERYRWLRKFLVTAEYLDGEHEGKIAMAGDTDGLDELIDDARAIDAAMKDRPR